MRNEVQHDEINLFRLVRRLEKAVQSKDSWEAEERNRDELRIKAHKELQKVKYARKLVKNVEGYEQGSSEHVRRIGAVKIALDKIEAFLKDTETKNTPTHPQFPSLLDQLPPPRDDSVAPPTPPEDPEDLDDGQTTPKATPASLALENDNFLLSPTDEFPGLPSSGLVSALPALMSAEPLDVPPPYRPSSPRPSTSTTALPPASASSSLTNRKVHAGGMEAHTSLQSELSSQLEAMAAQLKRNAMHFADALEKDKVVVEGALGKVEGNLGFMETQRVRLRDFAGKSGGTTWLTLGIVLVVLLLFVVMVGFIRLTRV